MSNNSCKRPVGAIIFIAICAFVLFVVIVFPFYWIVCTSFKETLDIYVVPPELFPKHFNMSNYYQAFNKYNVIIFF